MSYIKLAILTISVLNCNSLYAWQWPWVVDLSGIYLLDNGCNIQKETFKKTKDGEEVIEFTSDPHAQYLVLPYFTTVFTASTSFKMMDVHGGFKLKQINGEHLLIDFRLDFLQKAGIEPQYRSLSYGDLKETVTSNSEQFFIRYTAGERYGDLTFTKVHGGIHINYSYLNKYRPDIFKDEFVYVHDSGTCFVRKVN